MMARLADDLRVLFLEPHRGFDSIHDRPHAWHELVLILRGQYQVEVAGRTQVLHVGDAALYPAGTAHRPVPGDGRTLTMVCAMWSADDDVGSEPVIARDPSQRLALAATWLYDLHCRGDRRSAAALLAVVLAEIRRSDGSDAGDVIDRLHRVLRDNLQASHHLPNLAGLAGMSPTHLTRLYAARYGCTPIRHLRRLRVEAAVALIRDRAGDLADIARRCGLGSASHLSRVVRRETGRSPQEIRRGGPAPADDA